MDNTETNRTEILAESESDRLFRRCRRRMLEELRTNKDHPVLAEMAREILAGNVTPRQAMSIDAYSEALLSAGATRFAEAAVISDGDRAAILRDCEAALDELDEADEAEQSQADPASGEDPLREPADMPEYDDPFGPLTIRMGEDDHETWPYETQPPRSVRERAQGRCQ